MYNINLNWHSFNLCIPEVVVAITPMITSTVILGTSCNSSFQIHLEAEPTGDELLVVQSYWDSLTEASSEAIFYKSKDQIALEAGTVRDNLLTSAKTKLETLGFTSAEISAIIGA